MLGMRRREFITLLGSAAAAWPLAARAQRAVVGFLHSGSQQEWAHAVAAFQDSLKEAGYVADQNLRIDYRWAQDQYDRLPALAADLAGRNPSLMFVGGGTLAALAAKRATATIPIVFAIGSDPVKMGLVAALNRPGGNVTGVTFLLNALVATRLDLLRELSQILGLFSAPLEAKSGGDDKIVGGLMQLLLDLRAAARKSKNFAMADQIRKRLTELGSTLEDRAGGTGWRIG